MVEAASGQGAKECVGMGGGARGSAMVSAWARCIAKACARARGHGCGLAMERFRHEDWAKRRPRAIIGTGQDGEWPGYGPFPPRSLHRFLRGAWLGKAIEDPK